MSRFSKLSHVIWHCQYHIVWVPKYRYRVLTDKVGLRFQRRYESMLKDWAVNWLN